MQSAVLGFGVFRVLERYGFTSGLSIGENVILQTTSVATATMPLAAGKKDIHESGVIDKVTLCMHGLKHLVCISLTGVCHVIF